MKTVLVTGGAGFIGSALIRLLINSTDYTVVNFDALTYAGNLETLSDVENNPRYIFYKGDICNRKDIIESLDRYRPSVVMNLAAESHVDRSIDSPLKFIDTNVLGTSNLLINCLSFYRSLDRGKSDDFVFHHISTDEVYGDLSEDAPAFTERNPYLPSSPYSASKAASDHLVRAWHRTYGLPTLITNCSNNYGPYQFPEKLVPHTILNALEGRNIPIYGDGQQIRDWLFVDDHALALKIIMENALPGETFNVGGGNELTNLQVVSSICDIMEELAPEKPAGVFKYRDLIKFVEDRPGHDSRYAVDFNKLRDTFDWKPRETFRSGIRKTVKWYLEEQGWWKRVLSGEYRLKRLGGLYE